MRLRSGTTNLRRRAAGLALAACLALLIAPWALGWQDSRGRRDVLFAFSTEPADMELRQPPRSHVWVVRITQPGEFALLHRKSGDPPGAIYRAFVGGGSVEAIAASEKTLYVVYGSHSVQAIRFNLLPSPEPPGFPSSQLSPIPGEGKLVGFAASRRGPVAVVHEEQGGNKSLRLLRLVGLEWQELPLPAGVSPDTYRGVATLNSSTGDPVVFAADERATRLFVHRYEDEKWSVQSHDFAGAREAMDFLSLSDKQPPLLLALRQDKARIDVQLLRQDGVTPIEPFSIPAANSRWWAAAAGDEVSLLVAASDDKFLYSEKSIPGGEVVASMTLEEGARPIQIPPAMYGIIAALVIGMLFWLWFGRGEGRADTINLLPGTVPATFNRVAAATVDMAPAVAASMVIFSIHNPTEIVTRWSQPPSEWGEIAPALVAILIHAAHTTLSELFTASSLGKWVCGCKVVNHQGKPPHAWQVIARNFFKVVELIPPCFLLLFPMISPYFQRVGDLVGRTVVISTLPPPKKKEEPYDDVFDDIDSDGR